MAAIRSLGPVCNHPVQADPGTEKHSCLRRGVTLEVEAMLDSPADKSRLKPYLPGLRSSIEWLHTNGLPVPRLASLFGTNANHIRQLLYRARHSPFRLYAPGGDLRTLLARSVDGLRTSLKIRPEDAVVLSGARQDRILELEARVDAIVRDSKCFSDGVSRLKHLLPYIGYPGEVRWLRLLARVHHQMAWFLGHGGFSTSAFGEAKIALNLSQVAYSEWQDPVDLRRLTETCLIASNSCLLIGDAGSARKYLRIAEDACEAVADQPGSEHHRQLGVAYYQLHEDELARKCFERASIAMEAKGEAENQAQLLMTGKRHLALLSGMGWEQAQEVLSAVAHHYPAGSLQYVMVVNSAAACGFLTGSPEIISGAQELLEKNRAAASVYRHQFTLTDLLSITPDLPSGVRPAWIRRALYENAFKDL